MRKLVPLRLGMVIALIVTCTSVWAAGVGESKSYRGPTGLQLYSLRDQFKEQGVTPVLDQVRDWGFKYVEVAGTYGLSTADFKAELDKRGLVPIGSHFPYEQLRDDIGGVIRQAKELGLIYVGCAWIGHQSPFDEKQCRAAAEVFNRAGKALAEQGLKFYYHNHGYEFYAHGDGTLFDLLLAETDPRYVYYQMDVLWTVFPGQDPAKLLEKYPDRWLLLHLKDLKKGVPTGSLAGHTDLTNDVALGTGQVDWPALFRASQKAWVKYYFIEDESPTVVQQIPQSLRFLEQLEFAEGQAAATSADPAQERPKDRPASIRALAARVGVGPGAAVADIGAGKGVDTWVFADIVGESGTVYSEEITENSVKSLRAEVDKRKLKQVRPTLGRDDSPTLPPASVDLAYMRLVYHHFSKPREMLRELWRAIKPGGHLIIVDRLPGTLRDWVPREQRAAKHFWLGETTVVREAREAGFCYVACADELCEAKDNPFVLIFQRPEGTSEPGRDPDACSPLAIDKVAGQLLPDGARCQRPAIIALGQARELIPAILARSSGAGLEIILEEWATQKDERAPLPPGVSLPATLTDLGDPHLGPEPIDAVFFLDTYHLLFHGKTLLAKLQERLTPDARIYVLDRAAKTAQSRRDASHRRQIEPEVVKQEFTAAGFILQSEGERPAEDRFLLVFGKATAE